MRIKYFVCISIVNHDDLGCHFNSINKVLLGSVRSGFDSWFTPTTTCEVVFRDEQNPKKGKLRKSEDAWDGRGTLVLEISLQRDITASYVVIIIGRWVEGWEVPLLGVMLI